MNMKKGVLRGFPQLWLLVVLLLMVSATGVFAQKNTVSGIIRGADEQTIPGATVIEKGTTNGTISNASGKFSLEVSPDATLRISFVGMLIKEMAVGDQRIFDIILQVDVIGIEEVVAVGYGTERKISVTGAISEVNTKDLLVSPNASIANSLSGRITGVSTVQYSGKPGADDPLIFIRGLGSLSQAASSPLILVDGIERSFTQLDPNEIESISVLKDASSTAVFGVRGANGVIIVITRRGTTGVPEISISSSYGFQKPNGVPQFCDSYTHATLFNMSQLNDDPLNVPLFSETAVEAFRTNSDPIIYPNTDFVDYILKPVAFQTQQNINISGGTEIVKYFVSLGYLKQNGLFKTFDTDTRTNNSYDRYNFRTNLDLNATKTTKISLTTGGRTEAVNEPINTGSPFGYTMWRNVLFAQPFRGIGIVDGKHIISDPMYIGGESRDGLGEYYGRGFMLNNKYILNLDLELKQKLDFFVKGLSFRIKGSYNSIYNFNKVRNKTSPTYSALYLHDIDPTAPDDKTVVYRKSGYDGVLGYSESSGKDRNWHAETALSYDRNFGDHHVTGLLLYNQSKYFYPSIYPDIPRGYVGLVGRMTYDYKYKYLLDVNLGYNGSENFAKGKRFGFFPAVSVGWVISEENFMKQNSFVDFLKFRASYGVVGNDYLGSHRFLYLPDSYRANDSRYGYNFGTIIPENEIGASEGTLGNPEVSWEKSTKQNYGLNLKILNGKIELVADYFSEHRKDILSTRHTSPGITAISLPAVNLGIVDNHGYEIEVKLRGEKNNFKYLIAPLLTFARNKIVYMDEVPQEWDYLYRTGHPVGQPFGLIFDGYWTEEDVAHYEDFPDASWIPKPGDLRYKDLNGDNVVNDFDTKATGFTEWPEYVFGLTMNLNYKNFDLLMLWSGATNVSRIFQAQFNEPFGPTFAFGLHKYMAEGYWTPERGNSAYFPRMTLDGVANNARRSDYWIKDASYVRLKNIELGYTINTNGFLKSSGIKKLRVYLQGYNLLTFHKLKRYSIDPEGKPSTYYDYPIVSIANIGVNVVF